MFKHFTCHSSLISQPRCAFVFTENIGVYSGLTISRLTNPGSVSKRIKQATNLYVNFIVHPFSMKKRSRWVINTLIGMRSEVITLRL